MDYIGYFSKKLQKSLSHFRRFSSISHEVLDRIRENQCGIYFKAILSIVMSSVEKIQR